MWGHVEHVEQLGWGLCQHCLQQMPGGGGGSAGVLGPVYGGMDGGLVSARRVSVRESGRAKGRKAAGEFEEQTAPVWALAAG